MESGPCAKNCIGRQYISLQLAQDSGKASILLRLCQTLDHSQRAQFTGAMVRSRGDGSDRLESQDWKNKRQECLIGTVGQMV